MTVSVRSRATTILVVTQEEEYKEYIYSPLLEHNKHEISVSNNNEKRNDGALNFVGHFGPSHSRMRGVSNHEYVSVRMIHRRKLRRR
jgi:hypothetical protein